MVVLPMMTKDKERYQCRFKDEPFSGNMDSKSESYSGPSAEEILEDFAQTTSCSYRVSNTML